jgi:hypothetical protein
MVVAALLACKPVSPDIGPIPFDYPLDDALRMNEAQAIGTHNSYHVSNHNGIDQQDYTHTPLAWQLGHEGVRHFELDVWWDEETSQFLVYHIPVLDPETVCDTFVRCLSDIKGWSDFNPGHFPLVVIVETKDEKDEDVPARLDALDAEILSVWPEDRLVTPGMVQGDHPDLATALADEGWPVLGEVRGRLMLGLHTRGTMRTVYTDGLTVADRILFPEVFDGEPDLPFAALEGIDDPYLDDAITASLAKNRLVRTRADSDTEEARAGWRPPRTPRP